MNKRVISLVILIGLISNLPSPVASSANNNLNMNSVREVVNISSPQDITNIKTNISDSNVETLNSGQVIVYSNKLSAR